MSESLIRKEYLENQTEVFIENQTTLKNTMNLLTNDKTAQEEFQKEFKALIKAMSDGLDEKAADNNFWITTRKSATDKMGKLNMFAAQLEQARETNKMSVQLNFIWSMFPNSSPLAEKLKTWITKKESERINPGTKDSMDQTAAKAREQTKDLASPAVPKTEQQKATALLSGTRKEGESFYTKKINDLAGMK